MMIHSIRARKRCLSKKAQSLKHEPGSLQESNSTLSSTDGEHQADGLEVAVPCNKQLPEKVRKREVHNDTDVKQGARRVSHYTESDTGNNCFISELTWNPKDGARASQPKSVVFKVRRGNDDRLEVNDDISYLETFEKGEAVSCEIVNECSAATRARHENYFQHTGGECDELGATQQSCLEPTDENEKLCDVTVVLKHAGGKEACEEPFCNPEQDTNVLEESDDFCSNIWNMKALADEIMEPKENLTVNGEENTHMEEAAEKKLLAKECSLPINDTCDIYSDFDDPNLWVDTRYFAATGNYHCQDSRHGFIPQFQYCLTSADDKSACESNSTKVCDQSPQENTDKKILDFTDYCKLEYEAGPPSSSTILSDQSKEDTNRKIPIITVDSMDYCNLEHEAGLSLSSTKVCDQLKEDTDRKIPIITVDSIDYCNLEYEAGLRQSDFKPVQLANSFPATSEYSLKQEKNKNRIRHQGFKISRSHSDVFSLTMNRNAQFNRSADMFYESLSGPDGTDFINHGANGMTDSRRQSLEDIVPELPSRFLASTDRFGKPSGYVQNLFWWRRPSDITELRSRPKHPCEEEDDEGNTECEVFSSDTPCRRHSDNVFCKPKKFLTLRFNQLQEMWNRHSHKPKPRRKSSVESIEVVELQENPEDAEFRHRQEEKNELIINTLREVVRKCTIMDPLLRPKSEEVYKRLKKLLLN